MCSLVWRVILVFRRSLSFMATLCFLGGVSVSAGTLQTFKHLRPEEPLHLCEEQGYWLRLVQRADDWVEITRLPGLKVHMPYATIDNVSGHDLYCGVHRGFLHRDAAAMLALAVKELQTRQPGYTFLVFDAGRPRHAQELLYEAVRHTPYRRYVANPHEGSTHGFGMAVDLTILDAAGNELDMGTAYDTFEYDPQARGEVDPLIAGQLGEAQVANRKLLREVMHKAGFKWLDKEWWHFNAGKTSWVRDNYKQLEDRIPANTLDEE